MIDRYMSGTVGINHTSRRKRAVQRPLRTCRPARVSCESAERQDFFVILVKRRFSRLMHVSLLAWKSCSCRPSSHMLFPPDLASRSGVTAAAACRSRAAVHADVQTQTCKRAWFFLMILQTSKKQLPSRPRHRDSSMLVRGGRAKSPIPTRGVRSDMIANSICGELVVMSSD